MTKICAQMAVPMFCRLCDLGLDKGQDYSCLCHTSYSELQPLLKKTEFSHDECERLLFLIAVMAFEKYLLLNLSRECFESVKVMDVTVKESPSQRLESVCRLKKSALSACSDLLKTPVVAMIGV
jgi:hypothetical protein